LLFFELFPAFVMLVSLIVGIALFLANRRASDEPPAQPPAMRSDGAASGDPRTGTCAAKH
jgi:hypothetical protein